MLKHYGKSRVGGDLHTTVSYVTQERFHARPFSAMSQGLLSLWQKDSQEVLCKHMHVSFTKMPALSFTM